MPSMSSRHPDWPKNPMRQVTLISLVLKTRKLPHKEVGDAKGTRRADRSWHRRPRSFPAHP